MDQLRFGFVELGSGIIWAYLVLHAFVRLAGLAALLAESPGLVLGLGLLLAYIFAPQ